MELAVGVYSEQYPGTLRGIKMLSQGAWASKGANTGPGLKGFRASPRSWLFCFIPLYQAGPTTPGRPSGRPYSFPGARSPPQFHLLIIWRVTAIWPVAQMHPGLKESQSLSSSCVSGGGIQFLTPGQACGESQSGMVEESQSSQQDGVI